MANNILSCNILSVTETTRKCNVLDVFLTSHRGVVTPLHKDEELLERVQHRFTRMIKEVCDKDYLDRL